MLSNGLLLETVLTLTYDMSPCEVKNPLSHPSVQANLKISEWRAPHYEPGMPSSPGPELRPQLCLRGLH